MIRHAIRALVPLLTVSFLTSSRPASGQPQPDRRIAGIEIGSKSVKAVVLGTPIYEKTYQTNLTANLVTEDGKKKFNRDAITRTVEAVAAVHKDILDNHKGATIRFALVASSGVVGAVDGSSLDELAKRIEEKKLGDLPPMKRLTVEKEVELSFRGVTQGDYPDLWRNSTILVDVGSGNTKFGFAVRGPAGNWTTEKGEVRFGSNTFVGKTQDELKVALQSELTEKFTNPSRNRVIFTGGIVWAMISLENPEKHDKVVPFTYDLIQSFGSRARSADPFAVKVPGDDEAKKQALAVKAVFSREQLLAGAQILETVGKEFDVRVSSRAEAGRSAYFSRDGLFAWIIGFAEEEFPAPGNPPSSAATQDFLLQQIREDLRSELDRKSQREQALLSTALAKGFEKVAAEIKGGNPGGPSGADLGPLTESIQNLQKQIGEMPKNDKIEAQLAAIRMLIERNSPPAVARRDPERAWYNFYRGLEAYRSQGFLRAYEHFVAAIREDGEEPASWYGLALSQYSLGDVDGLRRSAAKLASFKASRDPFSKTQYNHLFMYVQGSDRIAVDESIKSALVDLRLRPRELTAR